MKHVILTFLWMLISLSISAQCTGSLGENIFTDGDFGSGVANILTPDPQIAPGYDYEIAPPPLDGKYTIANNISTWGSFASNWANIMDNSPDPNGYMMVVNASHDPGLFYEKVVNNLCENTQYVFSVDIFNLAGGIFPNVSFLLSGSNVFNTGDVPYNNQWNTYDFTFTTGASQNSLVLALSNNAPGGNGNDLALDNISFRACGPEANISPENGIACENGSPIDLTANIIGSQFANPQIQWQESLDAGLTWIDIPGENNAIYSHQNNVVGLYYYRYLVANTAANLNNNKCRIQSDEVIVEVLPIFFNEAVTICEGLGYQQGNNTYTLSGIYTDTLTSSFGCDSIITLDLTVDDGLAISADFSISDPSCHNFEDGSIILDSIINGNPPYYFELDGNTDDDNDGDFMNLGSGIYAYSITDDSGCQYDTVITLINPDLFILEIGDDTIIDLGESIEITPFYNQSPADFSWEYITAIDCDDVCPTLDLTPPFSDYVSLVATTAEGCVVEDSLYIRVLKDRKVFIPNAFSPNGDGNNDFLSVYASVPNVSMVEEFSVYDRWGSLLHKSAAFPPNSINAGWDGKSGGKLVNSGVYVYMAKIRFLDGEVLVYKGDVTLLR